MSDTTTAADAALDRLDQIDRPWTTEEAELAAAARRAGGGR